MRYKRYLNKLIHFIRTGIKRVTAGLVMLHTKRLKANIIQMLKGWSRPKTLPTTHKTEYTVATSPNGSMTIHELGTSSGTARYGTLSGFHIGAKTPMTAMFTFPSNRMQGTMTTAINGS